MWGRKVSLPAAGAVGSLFTGRAVLPLRLLQLRSWASDQCCLQEVRMFTTFVSQSLL